MAFADSACRLALLVVCSSFALAITDNMNTCKDPGDPRETTKSGGHYYHWTFLNNPQFRLDHYKNLPMTKGGNPIYTGREGFSTTKEATIFLRKNGGSLCPSIFNLQYDEDRYPRVLKQAKCMCRRCRLIRRKNFRCEPVVAYAQVWRKDTCKDGYWEYKAAWEEVTVGCSCNLKIRNKKP